MSKRSVSALMFTLFLLFYAILRWWDPLGR